MKKIETMTKAEMIKELREEYQYPVNENRSDVFIRKVLSKRRQKAQILRLGPKHPWGAT